MPNIHKLFKGFQKIPKTILHCGILIGWNLRALLSFVTGLTQLLTRNVVLLKPVKFSQYCCSYRTCLSCYCIHVVPTISTFLHRQALRGGADKSLARTTSRCRRTESVVSLERGVCSCAELQVFSCYRGWKEACQATCVISTTSRRELSSYFFPPARQGAEGNSRHSHRNVRGTCTIICHGQKLGGPV